MDGACARVERLVERRILDVVEMLGVVGVGVIVVVVVVRWWRGSRKKKGGATWRRECSVTHRHKGGLVAGRVLDRVA